MNSITVPDKPHIRLTRMGVIFDGQPDLQEWLDSFAALGEGMDALRWAIADMIIHAEGRVDWGEKYTQALGETPFALETLQQWVRVARAFPYDRRRAGVHWTHYQRLAALPEPRQEMLLDRIEVEDISTRETAEIVKEERAAGNARTDELPPIEEILPPCPLCGWPLQLHRGRCCNCGGTVNEMAYRYRDLAAAVREYYTTGARDDLDAVVCAYNLEDK
jgi:hypothetical protein